MADKGEGERECVVGFSTLFTNYVNRSRQQTKDGSREERDEVVVEVRKACNPIKALMCVARR